MTAMHIPAISNTLGNFFLVVRIASEDSVVCSSGIGVLDSICSSGTGVSGVVCSSQGIEGVTFSLNRCCPHSGQNFELAGISF